MCYSNVSSSSCTISRVIPMHASSFHARVRKCRISYSSFVNVQINMASFPSGVVSRRLDPLLTSIFIMMSLGHDHNKKWTSVLSVEMVLGVFLEP